MSSTMLLLSLEMVPAWLALMMSVRLEYREMCLLLTAQMMLTLFSLATLAMWPRLG